METGAGYVSVKISYTDAGECDSTLISNTCNLEYPNSVRPYRVTQTSNTIFRIIIQTQNMVAECKLLSWCCPPLILIELKCHESCATRIPEYFVKSILK